jgi:signal transduction histidine kinase
MLDHLTPGRDDEQLSGGTSRRSITLDAREVEALRETLDRFRLEVEELRASRERLVLAADADRRRIERDLHAGVQQQLVALAVNLQQAGALAGADPAGATRLLAELERDVQQLLDEAAQLAQRIYPPLLEAGLAATLRLAAVSAGIPVTVDVEAGASYPPEVAETVYLCWVEVLENAGAGSRPAVSVRAENGWVSFEVVSPGATSDAGLEALLDRAEALGGRLTIQTEADGVTRVSGSLPVAR